MNHADIRLKLARKAAGAWEPEKGDMLVGTIETVETRTPRDGQRGKAYQAYHVVTTSEDGTEGYCVVHAFHQLLADPLKEAKAEPGDGIHVLYMGFKENDGNGYHRYSVDVIKPE